MMCALTEAETVLETHRLRLAPMTLADTDLAMDLLTDPRVMRYVGGEAQTLEEVRGHMPEAVRKGGGGRLGIWSATLRETGMPIGERLTPECCRLR